VTIIDTKIIAHRGASLFAPENTRASLQKAKELGATWIETDVRLTGDRQLVIFHDDELNRLTNAEGYVALKSLAYLRSLDIGAWFSDEFKGEKILTLKEFIKEIIKHNFSLQLELKPMYGDEEMLVSEVVTTIKQYLDYFKDRLFFSSFSEKCIYFLNSAIPSIPRCMAQNITPRHPESFARDHNCQMIHVTSEFIKNSDLSIIRSSSIDFTVSTVNDRTRAKLFLENGFQSIITDDPRLLD
jgi:glycerophosphoryl diester phosphodiesterase